MEEEVLQLRREKLGADHPDTLNAMHNLAISYSDAGRLEEGLKMRKEVLQLSREKLGADHPDTLDAMRNLAISYSDAGRLEEALSFLRCCAAESLAIHTGVRYNLSCYECLSGNHDRAKLLIAEEISSHVELKDQAMRDPDLEAIRDFIAAL